MQSSTAFTTHCRDRIHTFFSKQLWKEIYSPEFPLGTRGIFESLVRKPRILDVCELEIRSTRKKHVCRENNPRLSVIRDQIRSKWRNTVKSVLDYCICSKSDYLPIEGSLEYKIHKLFRSPHKKSALRHLQDINLLIGKSTLKSITLLFAVAAHHNLIFPSVLQKAIEAQLKDLLRTSSATDAVHILRYHSSKFPLSNSMLMLLLNRATACREELGADDLTVILYALTIQPLRYGSTSREWFPLLLQSLLSVSWSHFDHSSTLRVICALSRSTHLLFFTDRDLFALYSTVLQSVCSHLKSQIWDDTFGLNSVRLGPNEWRHLLYASRVLLACGQLQYEGIKIPRKMLNDMTRTMSYALFNKVRKHLAFPNEDLTWRSYSARALLALSYFCEKRTVLLLYDLCCSRNASELNPGDASRILRALNNVGIDTHKEQYDLLWYCLFQYCCTSDNFDRLLLASGSLWNASHVRLDITSQQGTPSIEVYRSTQRTVALLLHSFLYSPESASLDFENAAIRRMFLDIGEYSATYLVQPGMYIESKSFYHLIQLINPKSLVDVLRTLRINPSLLAEASEEIVKGLEREMLDGRFVSQFIDFIYHTACQSNELLMRQWPYGIVSSALYLVEKELTSRGSLSVIELVLSCELVLAIGKCFLFNHDQAQPIGVGNSQLPHSEKLSSLQESTRRICYLSCGHVYRLLIHFTENIQRERPVDRSTFILTSVPNRIHDIRNRDFSCTNHFLENEKEDTSSAFQYEFRYFITSILPRLLKLFSQINFCPPLHFQREIEKHISDLDKNFM